MRHALALAARGLGRTWPNPAVGCVIVQGTRVVGRGWTQHGGRPHAERMALAQAGAAARGATAYVTLEPCAHHGQTPPCADALIAAGVLRVVTALTDPDARVSGKGHARLRASGVTVTEGIRGAEARNLNAGFLKRVTQGLPFVALKLATSLDGRIAMPTGESRWITGLDARRAVHAMRLCHDAVMIGSGTAIADDPDLTVRDIGAGYQPVRVIIDGGLTHPADSRLGRTARLFPVWICHTHAATKGAIAAWQAAGATLIPCASIDLHIDIADALRQLAERGLTRILCEGGAALSAALIRNHLLDEIAQFTSGLLIGAEGIAALGPLMGGKLEDAPRLNLHETRQIGQDTLSRWQLT
jgi:diaminohydroxyphosphoribosylaminopyrimidine deaminase / 5-amino-6-(5-phosphoribosylamino)uracil reductase